MSSTLFYLTLVLFSCSVFARPGDELRKKVENLNEVQGKHCEELEKRRLGFLYAQCNSGGRYIVKGCLASWISDSSAFVPFNSTIDRFFDEKHYGYRYNCSKDGEEFIFRISSCLINTRTNPIDIPLDTCTLVDGKHMSCNRRGVDVAFEEERNPIDSNIDFIKQKASHLRHFFQHPNPNKLNYTLHQVERPKTTEQ